MVYKIMAPVKNYTGDGYGLHFAAGQAMTESKELARYLQGIGYKVEDENGEWEEKPDPAGGDGDKEKPDQAGGDGDKELPKRAGRA